VPILNLNSALPVLLSKSLPRLLERTVTSLVLAEGTKKTMESAEPVTLLLPHLRSLWFKCVSFRDNTQTRLLACLRSRFQVGSAIRDLHLEDCWNIYEQDVEEMKAPVYHVDWDEIEQAEEDYYSPETGCDFEGIDDSD
jgi:hypothetical protein